MYEDDEDSYPDSYLSMRKLHANGKHIPNKHEGEMLRKLMSQNNMTEEEVRKVKKFRVKLANARSRKGSGKNSRPAIRLMRRVTKELKLAKEHPKCIARFNELLHLINSGGDPWGHFRSAEWWSVQPKQVQVKSK